MDHLVTRNSNPLRLSREGVHRKVQEVLRWMEAGTVTGLPAAWVLTILRFGAQEVTVTTPLLSAPPCYSLFVDGPLCPVH